MSTEASDHSQQAAPAKFNNLSFILSVLALLIAIFSLQPKSAPHKQEQSIAALQAQVLQLQQQESQRQQYEHEQQTSLQAFRLHLIINDLHRLAATSDTASQQQIDYSIQTLQALLAKHTDSSNATESSTAEPIAETSQESASEAVSEAAAQQDTSTTSEPSSTEASDMLDDASSSDAHTIDPELAPQAEQGLAPAEQTDAAISEQHTDESSLEATPLDDTSNF